MKAAHRMPFGAQFAAGHSTRFALWAPGCAAVMLELVDAGGRPAQPPRAMRRDTGGWHRIEAGDVAPGALYRFRLDDGRTVSDPASRFNPHGVHGPSEVVDPHAYEWRDAGWRGRPWHEAVVYELHVGTFTPEGTLRAAARRLRWLRGLGVTAVELMPLAAAMGTRGWGYDGVLPFAVDAACGRPEDLKHFVDEAHALGLMVLLDVVCNHFGPDGNPLHACCPEFFDPARPTPWGPAIAFDDPAHGETVRRFFVENALYWIEEFRLDGLRLDAVHAIQDGGPERRLVRRIAQAIRDGPGRERHVHLVLENEDNEAHLLRAPDGDAAAPATAQWNDDLHHAAHVLLSGERDGYYADYADDADHVDHVDHVDRVDHVDHADGAGGTGCADDVAHAHAHADADADADADAVAVAVAVADADDEDDGGADAATDAAIALHAGAPLRALATALAEGFVYQGQPSRVRGGRPRGEPSADLPATRFVTFLQNHDQVGNRAFGERLDALGPAARIEALWACVLLAPQIPMLFMGDEYGACTPFLYFCDAPAGLASAIAEGRRREFARFAAFADPARRAAIPDPNALQTFLDSRLDWREAVQPHGLRRLRLIRELLALRHARLVPLLSAQRGPGRWRIEDGCLAVRWRFGTRGWRIALNLGERDAELPRLPGAATVFALRADDAALQPEGVRVEEFADDGRAADDAIGESRGRHRGNDDGLRGERDGQRNDECNNERDGRRDGHDGDERGGREDART